VSDGVVITGGRIALSNNIPIHKVTTKTLLFGDGFNVTSNGFGANSTSINVLSSNIVVESNQIYALYNGLSGGAVQFFKNLSAVERLSAGHYKFYYLNQLPTTSYIPMVQISGMDALGYTPRVIMTSLSSFDVKILNNAGASTDANIYFIINY
jgi:hypothetical protein